MPAAQTALVIGGGIAGPVAATALGMAGIDAAVYEARPADPPRFSVRHASQPSDGIWGSPEARISLALAHDIRKN